ncbi:MAG: hypothetical protein WC558_04530 [Patulibacter sp.]
MSREADSGIDVEALLRRAMAPIEPPERLGTRFQETLQTLTEMAADELESWELAAMGDPRNWVRPAVAVAVGGAATTGLALLRWRQISRQRRGVTGATPLDRAAEDAARAVRRGFDRVYRR